ncbi:MAG: hypothetical protein LCH63_00715 [Candidatus Melainabacteria bacterium]|nr:hypothetical protein [Candidatus Melainabacteria bacterium]
MRLKRLLTLYSFILLALSCLSLLLKGLGFFFFHPLIIGNDQSVYLAMGQLLLKGWIPYRDFFDFNLPMIIYLSSFPALMGKLFPLPISLLFTLSIYLWFLLAVSLILAIYIRFRESKKSPKDLGLLLYILLGFAYFQSEQIIDLGQREYLFVIGFFPFLLLRYFKDSTTSEKKDNEALNFCAALMAFLALSLKPYFVLYWLVSEFVLSRLRRWQNVTGGKKKTFNSSEVLWLCLFLSLYGLHFLLYPKAALDVLLGQALPLYAAGMGWYETSTLACLGGTPENFTTTLLFCLSFIFAIPLLRRSALIVPLLTFNLTAFALFIFFSTSWTYRYLPCHFSSLILLSVEVGLVIASVFQMLKPLPFAHLLVRLLLPLGMLSFCLQDTFASFQKWTKERLTSPSFSHLSMGALGDSSTREVSPLLRAIIAHSQKGDAIISISTGVFPGYPPIVLANRRPGSRYLHGMHVPMLDQCLGETSDLKYKEKLDRVVTEYGDDILKNKPALVFIQGGPVFEVFASRDFFRKYMGDYFSLGDLGFESMKVYKLQKSKDVPATGQELLLVKRLLAGEKPESLAASAGVSSIYLRSLLQRTEAALEELLSNAAQGGEIALMEELKNARLRINELEGKLRDTQTIQVIQKKGKSK